jgi:hypothetical protein
MNTADVLSKRQPGGLAVSIAAFLLLAPGLAFGIPGGKAINGGLRILAGDIPYRDFWTMYAPGQFYLVAALLKVFGLHVLVQGVAVIVLIAAAAGVLFHLLTRRLALPVPAALVVTALFVAMNWHTAPEVSSYEPLILCAFVALNALLKYFSGAGGAQLAWAGLSLGVGAWFKHDVAFYLMSASAVALAVSWTAAAVRRPPGWVHPARSIALLAAGCAVTALPAIALVAWYAGPDAWEDLVRFPATDFRIVRGEPYPSLLPPRALADWLGNIGDPRAGFVAFTQLAVWILANMPQLVFVAGVAWLVRERARLAPAALAAAVLFLAPMPFFWSAAHVQQNTHLTSMAILSLLVGVLWWVRVPAGRRGRPIRVVLAAALAIYGTGMVLRPMLSAARVVYLWPESRTSDLPMVRGIRAPADNLDFYEPIVGFIRERVPEGEPIYVGVVRHDAIVISNQTFFYLSGRGSATRYNELHPGYADAPAYQDEMIADIERLGVRCIVLWHFGWEDAHLDSIRDYRRAALPHLGATVLDEYLRREFEVVARYGEYVLMWRRGAPAPATGAATASAAAP